jgi:hypothetical protein
MNFLMRIMAVDTPANTTVESFDFVFGGFTLGWFIFLTLLVLIGMAVVFFFTILERQRFGWFMAILHVLLLWSILFVLAFLMLKPVVVPEFRGERPRGVALLIDNSESMKQRDRRLTDKDKGRVAIAMGKFKSTTTLFDKIDNLPQEALSNPPRQDLVKGVLTHTELNLVEQLQKFGPLRPHYFGAETRVVPDDPDNKKNVVERMLAGFKAEEGRTTLADGIIKVLQSKDSDPPSAIVVMTDGQDNASKFTLQEAAEKCRTAGVPLHIYGVGSSEGAHLQLKEVGAPDTLFVEDTAVIPLRWRAQGFKKGTVDIVVTLGGKEVAKKTVNLQTGEDLRDALSFVVPKDPEKRESQDLVTTITYKSGGETFTDKMTRSLRVAETKIKILYIEQAPRWEFKFLQPALIRDRRIEVDFILVNADPKTTKAHDEKSPFLAEFPKTREKFFDAKYNLIILGDVGNHPVTKEPYLSKEQMEWIKEFVQNRGGLIVMAGHQNMPNMYENSPIAEVLPIEFKKEKFGLDVDVRSQEYPPTLTEAGQRTDWLSLGDTPEENLDIWQKKLQGFHWHFPATKLKPAATSLIVNPRAKIGDAGTQQPMPILATHHYGKGQVMWLGTDETWRWRWNYQDKYFVRFWGQVIYQFGLPSLLGDSAKRSSMSLDRSQAVVGTQSTAYVRLLDKDFNPRKDGTVDAELHYLDAKGGDAKQPIKLHALRGRPGEYTALLPHDRPGRFELLVRNPEENRFSYRVDLPPKHELEESGLAEKALRDAAEISGGKFYREEDLHQLPGSIEMKATEYRQRQQFSLLLTPFFLLILLLLTGVWLVRKFSDLS